MVPELYLHKQELAKAPAEIKQLVAADFAPSVVEQLEAFKGPRFDIHAIAPLINKISAYLNEIRVKYGLNDRVSGPVLFSDEDAVTTALYFRAMAFVESHLSTDHDDIMSLFSAAGFKAQAFYFVVNEEVPTWAAAFEITWHTGYSEDSKVAGLFLSDVHLDTEIRLATIDIVPFAPINGHTTDSSDFEHFLEFRGDKSGSVRDEIRQIMQDSTLDTWKRTLAIEAARKRTLEHSSLDERQALFKLYLCQTWATYQIMTSNRTDRATDRVGNRGHKERIAFAAERIVGLANSELLRRYPDLSKLYFHLFFGALKLQETPRDITVEFMCNNEFVLKLLELGDAGLLDQLVRALTNDSAQNSVFTGVGTAAMVQAARGDCIGPVFRLCKMAVKNFSNISKPENIELVVSRFEELAARAPYDVSDARRDPHAAHAALEFLAELLAINPTETGRVVHDTPLVRLLFDTLHVPGLAPHAGLVLGWLLEQDQITYSVVDAGMWKAALQTKDAAAMAFLCAGVAKSETGQNLMVELGFVDQLVARVVDDCFESNFYSERMVVKFVDTLKTTSAFINKFVAQIKPLLARLHALLDLNNEVAFDESGPFRRTSLNYGVLSRVLMVLGSLAHQPTIKDELHAQLAELVACLTHPHLPLDTCTGFSRQKYFRSLFDEMFVPERATDMLDMCINEVAEFARAVDELPDNPPSGAACSRSLQRVRRGRVFIDIYFSLALNKNDELARHAIPIILSNPVYQQLTLNLPRRLAEVLVREAQCLENDPLVAECFWQSASLPPFDEEVDTAESEFELFSLLGLDADEYLQRKQAMLVIRFFARGLHQFLQNANCLFRTACESHLLVPDFTPADGVRGLLEVLDSWPVATTAQRYALAAILDTTAKEASSDCGSHDFIQCNGYTIALELFEKLHSAPAGAPIYVNATARNDFVSVCIELLEYLLYEPTAKIGSSAITRHRMHSTVKPPADWVIERAAEGILVSLKSATRGITPPRVVTSILCQFDTERDLLQLEYLLSFVEQHWRIILAKADSVRTKALTLVAQVLLNLQHSFKPRFDRFIESLGSEGAPLLAAMLVLDPTLSVEVGSVETDQATTVQCILLKHAGESLPLERLQVLAAGCVKPSDVFFLSEYILSQINQQALEPVPQVFDLLKGALPLLLQTPDRYSICAFTSLGSALKALFECDPLVSVCGMARAISDTIGDDGMPTPELDWNLQDHFATNATSAQQALDQLAYIDNKTDMVYLKSRLENKAPPAPSSSAPLGALSEQMLLWSIEHVLEYAPAYIEARDRAMASAMTYFQYPAPGLKEFKDPRIDSKSSALSTLKSDWNALRDQYLRLRFSLDLVLPHCPSLASLIDSHKPLLESYFSNLLECTRVDDRDILVFPQFILIESLCVDDCRLVSLVLDSFMSALNRSNKLLSILAILLEAERSTVFMQVLVKHPVLAAIENHIEQYPGTLYARSAKKYYFEVLGMLFKVNPRVNVVSMDDGSDDGGEVEVYDEEDDKVNEFDEFDEDDDDEDDEVNGVNEFNENDDEDDENEDDGNISSCEASWGLLSGEDEESYEESECCESHYTVNDYTEDDLYGRVMVCPPRTIPSNYPHIFSLQSECSHSSEDGSEFEDEDGLMFEDEASQAPQRLKQWQQPYYRTVNDFDHDSNRLFWDQALNFDWYVLRRWDQIYDDREIVGQNLDSDPFFQASQRARPDRCWKPNGASKELCNLLLRRNWRDGRVSSKSADWAALAPLPAEFEKYRSNPEAFEELSLDESPPPIVVDNIPHEPPTYVDQFDIGTRLLCAFSHISTGNRIPRGLIDEELELIIIGECRDNPNLSPGFAVSLVKEMRNFQVVVPLDLVFPLLLQPAIFYNFTTFSQMLEFIGDMADKTEALAAPSSQFSAGVSMSSQPSLDTIFVLLCSRFIDDDALETFMNVLNYLKDNEVLPSEAIEQRICDELQRLLGASMEPVSQDNYSSTTLLNLDVLLSRLVTFSLCRLDRHLDLMAQLAESLSHLLPVSLREMNENSLPLLRSYMYLTSLAPQTTTTLLELFQEHGDAINNKLLESPSLLNLYIETLKDNHEVFSPDVKLKSGLLPGDVSQG